VSLQGAGDALKDLGPLRGIALDENGRLVLLSEGENQIGLPPLRMDDVVTVFRSVYEFGEAPSVSIDPDPKAPSGPTMLVRHGHATTDTYVGWVLFEADRVMKGYSLGRDNLTQKPLSTKIGGYQELFRHMGAGVGAGQKEIWERFWIVPAAVERRQSKNQRLTLFDVPLKLRTERMELREGKLVTAADPTPTKFAQAFSQWFTDHYAEIEAETIADPPPGRGIGSPVSCFAELRRIALITAIAETLRDQGVPIPAWIRDYPVKTCRVEPTTPAIDVGGPAQGWRIHGGVNLGVADKDLRTIPASPEAESLAPAVHHAVAEVSLLSTAAFTVEGKTYEAVVLPGAGTKALGACQLVASDLAVPVARGATISVTRRFHSFFRPAGEFGAGWTLDLPYLKEQSAPVSREDGRVLLRPTYQLGSPLDSLVATFRTRRLVQEVNAELLVPDQDSEILGLTGMEERRIGTPTQAVLFRGGECWHFDDAGRLVGVERAPLLIAYRRGDGGRLERIEGWYGKARKADIRLTYDDQGRLSAARGSDGQEVSYAYGASGGLTKATGPAGKLRYEYDANGQVRSVERNGRLLQAFAYSSRGELVRQRRTDGIEIGYQISPVAGGAAVAGTIGGQSIETATFDRALRPLERTLPDGTQIGWTNHESGAVDTVATTPGGDSVAVSRSADGKTEEWRLTEGGTYRLSYDPKGQVVTVSEGERPVSRQEYEADGQLRQIAFESSLLQAVYDDDRVLVGLHWTSPKEENQPANWLEIRLDESGRAAQMRDATGLELQVQYDTQTGEPSRVTSQRAHVEMQRNAQGQVVGIETSWGYRLTNILDADGHVKTAEIRVGDDRAMIHYQAGRPSIVKQMDGGQFRLQYHAGGENEGLVQQVETPNGLTLKYDYAQGHLTDVSVNQAYRCKLSYDGAGRLSECVHMPFAR